MSMVCIMHTPCCRKMYVYGYYNGDLVDRQAKSSVWPHEMCEKHGRSVPLDFTTYVDQEIFNIPDPRWKPLTDAQTKQVQAFLDCCKPLPGKL